MDILLKAVFEAAVIALIALVAMIIVNCNPRWRHLVGLDPELSKKPKEKK